MMVYNITYTGSSTSKLEIAYIPNIINLIAKQIINTPILIRELFLRDFNFKSILVYFMLTQ